MGDDFDSTRVTWVLDGTAVGRLEAVLSAADVITWDLETSGLDETRPGSKIVLASFTLPNYDTWILPLYHPESPFLGSWRTVYRRIATILRTKRLQAHNGKFDCRWTFWHTGVDLSAALEWDSAVSSHLLDENRSRKLKDRAPETFGVQRWDEFDLSKEGAALGVPLFDLGLYAARDTHWTQRLCMDHRQRMYTLGEGDVPMMPDEIEDARLGLLMTWCSAPMVKTLTAIEQRGILLDLDWVYDRLAIEREVTTEQHHFLGTRYEDNPLFYEPDASFAPTSLWFMDWASKAVAAGDLRVLSMTKTGKPQWSKEVLIRQAREGSEVALKLLLYRNSMKRMEFLNSWLKYADATGTIHASYNAGSVETGRLSSSSPNMQQVTKVLRPAFIPRPGFVIADFDYSQIELRVAAHIAKCEPMIEAFRQGLDLHALIAASIVQQREAKVALAEMRSPRTILAEDVTPDERQKGKAANFGFLFGQSAYGFRYYAESAYGVVMSDEEAMEAYTAFFDRWEGMAEWHREAIKRAERTGQVVSPIGRVRRIPGIHSPNEGVRSHAEKNAINSPVQGFASDLMQMASASIEGNLPGYPRVAGAQIVGTVHDSIVVELPEDNWQAVAVQVQERMVNLDAVLARMDCHLSVPLVADVTVGTRWGLTDVSDAT